MRKSVAILALLLSATSSTGQDLKFEAEILPNGSLEVRPADGVPTAAEQYVTSGVPGDAAKVFLWTDQGGALKGIFQSQAQAAEVPLMPGDTIQTYATVGFNPLGALLPSDADIQKMMNELAQRLFAAAKTQACGFSPLPETVTPSVSMSFGVVLSGTATLEATWPTKVLCGEVQ